LNGKEEAVSAGGAQGGDAVLGAQPRKLLFLWGGMSGAEKAGVWEAKEGATSPCCLSARNVRL
jgi:hypothetical protein